MSWVSEKRYFSVDYDEEYYIFDSTKISEEEVLEKAEYSYDVFGESLMENEVLNLLNENEQLKKENKNIQNKIIRLLDYVEIKQCVTRTEIKKWWNKGVKNDD